MKFPYQTFFAFYLISVFFCQCTEPETTAPETAGLSLPDGFKGELLYSPSEHEQGSWVAITTDPKGRLIVSDQYGYLYRVTVPESGDSVQVEKIPLEIGQAQGLLWAFNSLYVSVNSFDPLDGHGSGFYRLMDTDSDDQLDSIQTLVSLNGAGEHGPHSIHLSPDGNSLYFIAGNHTDVPEQFGSILPNNWKEDRLFPAFKDPRGHANLRKAPGGWIVKTDPEGKEWEVVASGFRNAYDIAFNEAGELFTFDSDMEWDLGSPWYRPIRVCHAINGAEFGWRTGSGKWPAYYPDNLPGVVDIGQGSPTGIVMGKGTKFPQRYQKGLFILDWSFGTMFFVEMTPNGSTYTGTKEEFLSGKPLPLADATIGADGSMYFVTGGRRIESGLYRVSYVGTESTEPAAIETNDAGSEARATRHMLEDLQKPQVGAIEKAWPYLNHEDRFIRYAARVAIENQPVDEWKELVMEETDPVAKMQGTLALARMGDPSSKDNLAKGLLSIDASALGESQQLDLIRTYGLVFSRMGAPANLTSKIKAQLPDYPTAVPALDRELCDLLAYLQEPELVATTMDLMEQTEATIEADLNTKEVLARSEQYGPTIEAMHENRPLEQGMAYAMSLSRVKTGWTPELRKR
ncbi:MAG: PQQ-dependent sugar dehydrogenase, partial [Cyclobacteriaceae bacterium]